MKTLKNLKLHNNSVPGESKTLIYKSASEYSRLTISKSKGLDKLTMCAAVMGSGVLLQYSGVSSITGKDLYIATGLVLQHAHSLFF